MKLIHLILLMQILLVLVACSEDQNDKSRNNELDSAVIRLNQKKAEAEILEREIEELRKKNDSLSKEYRKYEIIDSLALIQKSTRIDNVKLITKTPEKLTEYWKEKLGFNFNSSNADTDGSLKNVISFTSSFGIEISSIEGADNIIPKINTNRNDINIVMRNNSLEVIKNYLDQIEYKSAIKKSDDTKILELEFDSIPGLIFVSYNSKRPITKNGAMNKNGAAAIKSLIYFSNEPENFLDNFIALGLKPERRTKLKYLDKEAYKFNLTNGVLYLTQSDNSNGIAGIEFLSEDLLSTEKYFTSQNINYNVVKYDGNRYLFLEYQDLKLIFSEGKTNE